MEIKTAQAGRPATLQVSRPATLTQFYRDFSSPDYVEYLVNLKKETPALQQKVESLSEHERRQYAATFAATWNGLDPASRGMILGGVAGGAAGAGLALTTLSIKRMGDLIGGPVGFVVGLAVLGVVSGALTPAALNHFVENSIEATVETPNTWNLLLPKANLKIKGSSSQKTTGSDETAT